MKILVATDSFKGSLSSIEAGEAIKIGILNVMSDAKVQVCPVADGGEGTVDTLVAGMGGRLEEVKVTGPLEEKIVCSYGIVENNKHKIGKNKKLSTKTAVIEMSAAAGITLVAEKDRNPLNTTTYGVGEIIKDAIIKGCRHFIIGIGGSATNDGGIGMLQALGYGVLDETGNQVPLGAKGLEKIVSISDDQVIPELKECTFRIACDVKNPLYGENGCSAIFGPQKGATTEMIKQMDQWLIRYAEITNNKYKDANANQEGTGAAGGLGFAFLAYTNAVLESGIKIIFEETDLENKIKEADIIITGEGKLDEQTILGKVPIGIAVISKKYHKPVIAIAGAITEGASICNEYGIDAMFSIQQEIQQLEVAMESSRAKKDIIFTTEQIFRLILLKK